MGKRKKIKWGERNRAAQARRELQLRREAEVAQERAQACINASKEQLQRIHWDVDDNGLSAFRGCTIAFIVAAGIAITILLIQLIA